MSHRAFGSLHPCPRVLCALLVWCGIVAAEPVAPCNAELIPKVVALVGANPPLGPMRGAATFQTTLFFAPRDSFPSDFKRDLLVSLGDADIARISVDLSGLRPGDIAEHTLALYVPRGLPAGPAELRVGFLRDGAPGEMKREDWTYRRAAAFTVDVVTPSPPEDLTPEDKEALLRSRPLLDAPNLLANGSFDGLGGWRVDRDILEGEGGWNRVLREHLDARTLVEPPFSMRIDFLGGQDPNIYGIGQDVKVEPRTHYTLSYLIRTENISSNGLPCLDVMDAERPMEYFYVIPSPAQRFRGSVPWTMVSFDFTTPPETRILRVKIRRHGSGPSEYRPLRWGPIGGSVWFDAIRLVEGGP